MIAGIFGSLMVDTKVIYATNENLQGDTTATMRLHSATIPVNFAYRYVFGTTFKSLNQMDLSAFVFFVVRSCGHACLAQSAARSISPYTLLTDIRSRVHEYNLSGTCMLRTLWGSV